MSTEKIKLAKVCKDRGIRFVTYSSAPEAVKTIGIDPRKTPGITFVNGDGTPVILFDGGMTPLEIQFTIAHELGHILLGHLNKRKSSKDQYPDFAELEADCFAAAILIHNLICQYGQAD